MWMALPLPMKLSEVWHRQNGRPSPWWASATSLWKLFRDQAERGSGIGLKLFGFIAESVFTFIPESSSGSPGIPFGIIPESRSL
jgi:hypothetical protein